MGKFLFAVVAAVASLVAVESLVCNNCPFNLLGKCVGQFSENCALNSSVCYIARSQFLSLTNFGGFNTQGCTNVTTNCNATTSSTLLGATYNTTITCCSSNGCNPVFLNGAPSTRMTFTAAVGGAVLATVLGSIM